MIVVLMGVSGSGKTRIGTLLAARMGIVFADADDYHSAANKAKMAAGHPLDDADRAPWLAELNRLLQGWHTSGSGGVLACSALKASYRTTLEAGMPEGTVRFVLLDVPKAVLAERLAERKHSFMNPGLLDSQIATLERPVGAVEVCNDREPEAVVGEIVTKLAAAN